MLDQSFWVRTRDLLSSGTQKRYIVLILALVILAGYTVKSQSNNSYNGLDLVDKNGIIRKPADYRDRYQALTGVSLHQCPVCRRGRMLVVGQITRPTTPPLLLDTS